METLLSIGMIPVTVGGLAMYLKLRNIWLRVLGIALFGIGLFYYIILPVISRVPS